MQEQDKDLLALKALAEKATPGPWQLSKYGCVMDSGCNDEIVPSEVAREDKLFVAAANPATILSLLERLHRAETVLNKAGFVGDSRTGWQAPEREVLANEVAWRDATIVDLSTKLSIAEGQREVLATGKGAGGEKFDELVRDLYNFEGGRHFALRLEKLLESATPSTPSQAWEGELPNELIDQLWSESTGDTQREIARNFARKAIGAAIAGVADLAVQWGNARLDDHGGNALRNFAEYIRSLSSNPVSLREKARADDFAKIVRATSGQQVLFYKEDNPDEGNTLHCVATFDDFQFDMKMAGLPDDAFAAALDKADTTMADQVLAQVADLGFGDTASNGNGEKGGV